MQIQSTISQHPYYKQTMSFRKRIGKILTDFLTVDTKWAVLRSKPTDKTRKYQNVEITEDFQRIDRKRWEERLQNMQKRKLLLEERLKLSDSQYQLSSAENETIKNEIVDIQKALKQNAVAVAETSDKIEELEPDYVVIEGHMKLVVLNEIKYLQYMEDHNNGFILNPETVKMIENVHYCVNHNLPVNRIKLYEVMPDYFESEIGQFEESVQRLIHEKKLYQQDETGHIRFFERSRISSEEQTDYAKALEDTYYALFDDLLRHFSKYEDLLKRIEAGKTPFRNQEHFVGVLLSDLKINYLPEELQFKEDLLAALEVKKEYEEFEKEVKQEMFDMAHNYVEPPIYIARHPVLMKKWEEVMVRFTNPVPIEEAGILPQGDMTETLKAEEMQTRIRQIVRQKYDPLFVEAMNKDRSLINNKQTEIDFYSMSTEILEQLQIRQNDSEQQFIEQLPKSQSQSKLGYRRTPLVKMDELTRMLYLNNKDHEKYSLDFFVQWFGVDRELLADAVNSFSYLKAEIQNSTDDLFEEKSSKDFKFKVIKFKE